MLAEVPHTGVEHGHVLRLLILHDTICLSLVEEHTIELLLEGCRVLRAVRVIEELPREGSGRTSRGEGSPLTTRREQGETLVVDSLPLLLQPHRTKLISRRPHLCLQWGKTLLEQVRRRGQPLRMELEFCIIILFGCPFLKLATKRRLTSST